MKQYVSWKIQILQLQYSFIANYSTYNTLKAYLHTSSSRLIVINKKALQ